MKRSHLQIALYLLAVFVSGALVGAFAFRLYTVRTIEAAPPNTPEAYRRKYVGEMKGRLSLNDDQTSRLNHILDQTRARANEVKKRYKPEMDQIHEEQVQDIRAMLSVSQATEYDKYLHERELEQKAKDAAAVAAQKR
jgi:hypothetical protein